MVSLAKQMLGLGMMFGVSMAGSGVVFADQDHRLGAPWPAATDASRVPGYHVYRFNQDGVKYIQINGADGSVLAAVAATNSAILPLPMGSGAIHVSTASEPSPISDASSVTIYTDGSTRISLSYDAHGEPVFTAAVANGGNEGNHGS